MKCVCNELVVDSLLINTDESKIKRSKTSFSWSSCYKYLVVGYSEGTIELYTHFNEILELTATIKNQTKRIYKLSWSPHIQVDSTIWFASASEDTTVLIYAVNLKLENLQCILIHRLIYHVATVYNISWCHYHPLLLSTNSLDQSAVIWWLGESDNFDNNTTFEKILLLSSHSNLIEIHPLYILPHAARVLYSIFSSNIGELYTTTDEQLLIIWDLKDCSLVYGDVKNEYICKYFCSY